MGVSEPLRDIKVKCGEEGGVGGEGPVGQRKKENRNGIDRWMDR